MASKARKVFKKIQKISRMAMYPVTIVVLFIVYWTAVGVTAILMKLSHQDPLEMKKVKRLTMWIERKPEKPDMAKATRQF